MKKPIRLLIVSAVVIAVIAIAGTSVAWAKLSPQSADAASTGWGMQRAAPLDGVQPAAPEDGPSASSGYQGTVLPNGCTGVNITESGQFSICGIAVLNVDLKASNVELILTVESLPADVSKALVGTVRLDCFVDGKAEDGPHDPHAALQLCFAAPPDKDVQVMFFDEAAQSWTALETKVEGGQACAPANYSGRYILVEK